MLPSNFIPHAEFALLFLSLYSTSTFSTQFTHDRKRVGPLDLVMAEHDCLKTFTVSENTIIRTQDSRFLGAKFLNESDVGNREDCLSFCCNTRFCDVAVFQEKSPFSCYLFDCGPPDDFVCKFTSHTYYTSAVLAVNRHQLDLGVWSSQYQHEAELTDLRSVSEGDTEAHSLGKISVQQPTSKKNVEPTTTTPLKTTTTSTTALTTTHRPQTPLTTSSKQQNTRKCSNFQFECHSGECIAIYNACDGIPQCHDGSDEGAELGCPQGPAKGVFNHHSNILEYNHYANDGSPDYTREDGIGYGGHGKGPGYYDYNLRVPQQPKYSLGHQDIINGEPSSVYHPEYPDYGGLIGHQRDIQHLPSQGLRQQQVLPSQTGQQMKVASLRNPSSQMYQHQQQEINNSPLWQRANQRYPSYPMEPQQTVKQNHRFGDLMHDSRQGIHQTRIGNSPQTLPNGRVENGLAQELEMGQNHDHFHQTHHSREEGRPPPSNEGIDYSSRIAGNPSRTVASRIRGGSEIVSDILQDPKISQQDSVGHASPDSLPSVQDKLRDPVQPNNVSQAKFEGQQRPLGETDDKSVVGSERKEEASESKSSSSDLVAHSSLSRLSVDIAELKLEEDDQKSQTSGAILALSLGMCITALLIVLVGCRIRGVKRRARRRRGLRSPLEHDADYLVNGMYL